MKVKAIDSDDCVPFCAKAANTKIGGFPCVTTATNDRHGSLGAGYDVEKWRLAVITFHFMRFRFRMGRIGVSWLCGNEWNSFFQLTYFHTAKPNCFPIMKFRNPISFCNIYHGVVD